MKKLSLLRIMRLVKKSFKFKIDLKSLFKYLLTSIVIFGIIGIIMEESLEYKESIFEFLPSVIPYAIIAILLYLATTYLIDKRTKILVKGIISEFRKTKNK